jgi:diadenosine tetraphosphate (Ap4A) HIT family hydrolase
MSDCVFCGIVAGQQHGSIIHQDELALVMLDLFPVRSGHGLIVLRRHVPRLEEVTDAEAGHVFNLARRLIVAQKSAGMAARAHNLVVNDGPEANQHIPHLHLHVIPRRGGDTLGTAFTWGTRMLNVFGMRSRRARLDRQAALLAEHFPKA